jgi:hypothetical protein
MRTRWSQLPQQSVSVRFAAAAPAVFLTVVGLVGCGGESKLGVYREPPQVIITKPAAGSTYFTGEAINFEAEVQVYDGNTEPQDITHRWVGGEETMCEGEYFSADGYGACSWSFDEAGAVSVQVTATDPNGDRAMYSVDLQINANTPPSIELTGPEDGSDWSSDDLIVFDAIVADAEEDASDLVVSASSNIDGAISFSTSPTSTGEWAGGASLSAGSHLLTFIVEDSFGQSDQDTLQLDVFDNGPPSIDSVNITPVPAYTEDDLVAVTNGWVDFTGDAERYRYGWYVDDGSGAGFQLDASISTATFPNGKTVKHDLLYVEVTPYNDFGDGAMQASPVTEVLNTPPDQPAVAMDPSSPQPDQNVTAVILTGSYDPDGDPITYEYDWYLNGVSAGVFTNVLSAGTASNGDTVEVVVTPYDGEDYGPSISVSSSIIDVTAPDAPVINTPDRYRNEDEWTLSGTCEPAASVDFSCADSVTTWSFTVTCASDGTFEYTDSSLTRGETSSCVAVATDSAGNVSGSSNTVTTEVCDPEDTYEDAFGTGDAGVDSVDRWTALSDDGRTTISIEGNIVGTGDSEDWYVISTSDDIASDRLLGIDYYNLEVLLVDGTSDYEFNVYKDTYDAVDLECPSAGGYTEYSDFVEDIGDGSHAIPSETRACASASEFYNQCEDRSTDYYIQVTRTTSSTSSCQSYELEVTNGVW